ncbi:hypothetical protein POM88_012075 [Heracleum sosnowskyi]|uniref:ATP-dependent DNA helicase n=1 Tax=Heracleum sosnowskyi TaxID=360622 RepID=A0AAD8N1D8_9APIA|nr:hypothetical protein POM88_012075 [Heracleum sosnowskyi]
MKEVGYSHLNLDNLFSVRDEVGKSGNKSSGNRKTGTKNCKKDKENCVSAQKSSIVSSFDKCDFNNIDVLTLSITGRSPFADISNRRTFPISVNIEGKRTSNLMNEGNIVSTNSDVSVIVDHFNETLRTPQLTQPQAAKKMRKISSSRKEPGSTKSIVESNGCETNHHHKLASVSCCLNFENSSTDKDIESSTISELQADEGELFWDDEYDFPCNEEIMDDDTEILGPPTECCNKCHAILWKEERANKNVKHGVPKFSLCCGQGQIKLPCTPPTPPYLLKLYSDPKNKIDKILKSIGKSLYQFKQLPQPPPSYLQTGLNNLVVDETSYNLDEMEAEFQKLFPHCNEEQLQVYNDVLQSVTHSSGGVFFVYGSGRCGKTFVWKTLIYKLRSLGLIVLPVASSGIVVTLMPGGRTAHSRFKIPIVLDDCSSCSIRHDSDIAELIKRTSLIIWDEAPM